MAAQLTQMSGGVGALALLVNGAGDQFLAGARLALDQHGDVGRSGLADAGVDRLHGGALADHRLACAAGIGDVRR